MPTILFTLWQCIRPLMEREILQYQHPYLDPYARKIKAHLMLVCVPHIKKQGFPKIGEKNLANKSFLLYGS